MIPPIDNRLLGIGAIITILTIIQWWRDVTRGGTYQGLCTKMVTKGLRWGIILFIISEVLSFVSFFCAFFHTRLSPTIELGSTWPPTGIQPFNPIWYAIKNLSSNVSLKQMLNHCITAQHSALSKCRPITAPQSTKVPHSLRCNKE